MSAYITRCGNQPHCYTASGPEIELQPLQWWQKVLGIVIFLLLFAFVGTLEASEAHAAPVRSPKDTGVASYYSEKGCVDCRKDRIMKNGKRFDETKLTIAMNKYPLGTMVWIDNPKTGRGIRAEITDRGPAKRLGRIADLSLQTKKALGCEDLCQVEITKL